MPPALIALDWGSSTFRAYLVSAEGAVLDEVATQDGVAAVLSGGFAATLARLVGGWLADCPSLPILASGMIGSRHGWREAPYVLCPANPKAIAGHLIEVEAESVRVRIAPGLMTEGQDGEPDVMRGEEVEILGIADSGAALIVLPGSHSKWAVVDEGRVMGFKTFVTGELFAAIRDHTLIGAFARAVPPKPPGNAFARGVARGAETASGEKGAGLLGALFGARALPLAGKLAEEDAGDYLSGLLIGAEIAEARRLFPAGEPKVAGAAPLVQRYLVAFDVLSQAAAAAPPRAAARGLYLLAREAGLI